MTLSLVSTVTVGAGGAASIEFTGIPGTATDLLVVLSLRNIGFGSAYYGRFNGDAGNNYVQRRLYGTGSSVASQSFTSTELIVFQNEDNDTANTFSSSSLYISNYANTGAKSASLDVVTENNASNAEQGMYAISYTGTAAITSLTFLASSGNLAQYSTVSLYTITKGSGGATVA